MENAIKTIVDDRKRMEIYDHDRKDGFFANGLKLKAIPNMTQGQEYEILEEKKAKEILLGMIYIVEDNDGNRRHISDKYFHQPECTLSFDSEIDNENILNTERIKEKLATMPNLDEHRDKIKTDFANCQAIDAMPSPNRECEPTVRGLKEEYENNIRLNKLAGTWKGKQLNVRQPLSRDNTRLQKSSIEEELDLLRENCLDMIERIDAMGNAIEAVRKFA